MDDYAGRILADRYRLPLPPSDEYELVQTRAFDAYSGQEVLVRQLPLPEVVEAEVLDGEGAPGPAAARRAPGRTTRRPADPAVRRAVEAAQAAAQIPDHPRLDQVFDVFAEAGSLWIVSELIPARPLAALLAEQPLDPYRAAEIASDVLTALRVLHAHGWTHRNITVRTVLICDDGRVVLTGLAAGAAEEALCGYAPVPLSDDDPAPHPDPDFGPGPDPGFGPELDPGFGADPAPEPPAAEPAAGVPPARAGAVAAYRAGVRAAARAHEAGLAAPGRREPEPQWWSTPQSAAALADTGPETGPDDDAEDEPYEQDGAGDGPRRALLAGVWHDGPASSRPVPAGGSRAAGSADALRADAQRQARRPEPAPPAGHGEEIVAGATDTYRGPATPLAAERARQARIAVVGAVTERWAPEQAGPVHGTWQLAPPIGPATDLWALGALLYRAVQGHAPYPEESAAELVQMVCAEPPAYAEECGPLRPVVESLLRQDPTERPDVEELRGWLRSLIRSAPEPDAGMDVVPMPSVDATRLPVVRRRGELVRRWRAGAPDTVHGRHRHRKTKGGRSTGAGGAERPGPGVSAAGATRAPRALGRTLLVAILLVLAAAVAYAAVFMPKAQPQDRPRPEEPLPRPTATAPTPGTQAPSPNAVTPSAVTSGVPRLAAGYVVRDDPEGFRVGVAEDWRRSPINDVGQVRYTDGDYTLIVVPGRDTVQQGGGDPLEYQRTRERELQPWRDSSWATASGLRRVDVGRQSMAEGQFTWQDANGREVYVRNLALVIGDRYHVIQVIGPESQRDEVAEIYQQAVTAYRSAR
ncbi:protein kinase [Streptomyces sp. NPDC050856]|uniref:protein kinase n=1 Tax=Streptomyces sp. NPDC050856 TaxID=3154939 RepID=UPI0033C6B592